MKYNVLKMEDALEALIDYRGKTPEKAEEGIDTLSAKSVKDGYIDYSLCYQISAEEYKRFMVRGFPQIGDILLTTEAPLGLVARLDRNDVAIAQRLLTLRGKKGVLDNDYLMYYLQSPKGQAALTARATGTTVTGIKQAEFRKIELELPEYDYQVKVSGIIRAIDEKIALNKKINNNLLEQINCLCSEWIEHDIVPEGWSEFALSDIADFVGGYSYKSSELVESTTAMATIKNFDRNGGFKLDGFKELQPSPKIKSSQFVELFDILVAHTDLTQNAEVVGNAELIMSKSNYDRIAFSMDLVKVVPTVEGLSNFLLGAILQTKRFKAHCLGYVNGTTVLHLSKKALPEYRVMLPNDLSYLKPLDEAITFLYKEISANVAENLKLELIRDSILPKLMSGDLDVSEVKI